jgi:hypothetical protein
VPDSLTALAILALVGLPGYAYLQLRGVLVQENGPTAPPSEASALNPNFETVIFGLVCALGGAVVSLIALDDSWIAIFSLYTATEPVDNLPLHLAGVLMTAFAGSLVMAVLLAGIIRARHFSAELRRLRKTSRDSASADANRIALGHGATAAKAVERPGVLLLRVGRRASGCGVHWSAWWQLGSQHGAFL